MPLSIIRAANSFNAATVETVEAGIPYFSNQFWTSRQRQGNAIHEISYRACFKPELAAFFIDLLSQPGERVYDPYMGRGTTLIQAALMGREPCGNDLSPLCAMLARPRLNIPDTAGLMGRLLAMPITAPVDNPELAVFYHPDTLMRLCALKGWFARRQADGQFDALDDWIRMVVLNRLHGHSPGFCSVYTLPPNQAASLAAQRRINAKRQQTPPYRDVTNIVLAKSRSLLKDGGLAPCAARLLTGDAAVTPAIADASVALVVTSPPFLDVVHYDKDNWLRLWFAGLATPALAQLSDPQAWQAMVRGVLAEQARLVRPGGYVAFEVGEVRRASVLLERLVWEAAEGLPFDRLGVIVNGGAFSKTSQIWKVTGGAGTNTNRIVLLRRQ